MVPERHTNSHWSIFYDYLSICNLDFAAKDKLYYEIKMVPERHTNSHWSI